MSISDSARKIPGVAAAEGAITGALATEQDLPIAGFDKQTPRTSRRGSTASRSASYG